MVSFESATGTAKPTITLNDLLEQARVDSLAIAVALDLPQDGGSEAVGRSFGVEVLEESGLPRDQSELT